MVEQINNSINRKEKEGVRYTPLDIISVYKNLKDSILEAKNVNEDDNFKCVATITFISSMDVNEVNPKKEEIEFEVDGKVSDFFKLYEKALNEKVGNLNQDKNYVIYDWKQSVSIYDKNEKDINEDTNSKASSDRKIISKLEFL
jgi:hypothetical protein